jgi:hypothetical protein
MLIFLATIPLVPPGPCLFPVEVSARPQSIDSIVSDNFPIRVHWQEPAQEAQALLVRDYAELAWQVQVEELGFRAPQLPDSADGPELDFYLKDVGGWAAWASPDSWSDAVEGDGYASVPAYLVIDSNITDDWIGLYTAHEFNHVLQWSMDYNEPSWPIFEAVATAAQGWTLGESGLWDGEVNTFQEIPWAPAILGDSYVLYDSTGLGYYYEYGASLWVMHLDQVLGSGDGGAGVALWEATANEGPVNEPDALDAFVAVGGGDLGQAMNDLARTRWLVGDQWDDRGLIEAEQWGAEQMVPASELSLETPELEHRFDPALQVTGQGFVTLDTSDLGGKLSVSVSSSSGLESAVTVLTWNETGSTDEASSSGLTPSLDVDLGGIQRLVLAVSNLGPPSFDGDQDPYVDGDQVLRLVWHEPVASEDTGSKGADTDLPVAEERGCACAVASAPVGSSWLLGLLSVFVPRRRIPRNTGRVRTRASRSAGRWFRRSRG